MVYTFFDKKFTGNGVTFMQNQHLANKLHKQLENLKDQGFINLVKTIFWVLI